MQELTKLAPLFKTVTNLGQIPFIIVLFIGVFNLMPKPAALYFWCAMSIVEYTTCQLKSLYAEDRPYWVSDEIQATYC